MVKIIEKSQKEKNLEQKVSDIMDYTTEITSENPTKIAKNIYLPGKNSSDPICIYARGNEISLSNPDDFETAKNLAESYEKNFKEEWTLKKDY